MADLIKYFFPITIELFIELRAPLAQTALVNTTLEEMKTFRDLCVCRLAGARLFGLGVWFERRGGRSSNSTEELEQDMISFLGPEPAARRERRLVNKSYSPAL
jgi:hypothetical protein